MDINILNKNYEVVAVCDVFESLIWNVKYNGYGDFELCVPANSAALPYLREDYYLEILDSNRTMIIEHYEPLTDVEEGSTVMFSGRSLESILTRRIVWTQTILSGNLQEAIKKILNDAFINPSNESRRIHNFVFIDSDDPNVTGATIDETMFTGDEVIDVVEPLCQNAKLGWIIALMKVVNVNTLPQIGNPKILYILDENKYYWDEFSNTYKTIENLDLPDEKFVMAFRLYSGKNRTTKQTILPHVVFSLYNDNLFSAKRTIDKKNYKNVTLVAGEGEGTARRTLEYGEAEGLERREYFTDARDISSNKGRPDAISDANYNKLLAERGKTKLAEQTIEREVEAEVDTSVYSMFTYQKDYFIGDVVENVDEYGVAFASRINEMTIHLDSKGYSSYPIFEQEDMKENEND